MKKTIAISIALLFILPLAWAQDWAKQTLEKSPRHQEWVDVKHDNRVVHAFIVYPEVKGKAPVVIVIHEIFGLSDCAQSVADQLATHGYIAIAPDLLSGLVPKSDGSTTIASTQDVTHAAHWLE